MSRDADLGPEAQPVYDAARFGSCLHGHPLNERGRCAVIEDPDDDLETDDIPWLSSASPDTD
jgi:hypothetical protein